MKKRKFDTDKVFDILNTGMLILFGLCTLYPFIYVLSASISQGTAVDAGKIVLMPQGVNFDAFRVVMADKQFWISYGNTFFYTIFGSLFSMLVSTPAAYALSRKRFQPRKFISIMLAFTMWFSPGFIPLYLNYRSLGTINNRWMMLISFGIQAFYIILLKNYFEAVSTEIEESAKIDGANDIQIFFHIFLPLAKPALATVWLYYAISRWNGYFWSAVLIKETSKIPLQVYLKQKIIDQALIAENAMTIANQNYSYTTLIYAMIVLSIIPVLILYPYIQKFFVKGIMVGGVKG